jgi:pyridinium-3,5-bisthiocarboxylic acid mononucleotide nickel chelatase
MKRAPRSARAPGMRVLHLDPFSGIAGNMFLGALLDAGLSRRALVEDLAALEVGHRLVVSKVRRGPLAARYVRVVVPGARGRHAHPHGPHDPAHHGRSWREIRRLLSRAKLRPAVRERALVIFTALAEAEGRVHGIAADRVHFHEVGAVDAIVDVVGAAIALDRLGVSRVTSAPPALGHGSVESAHGRIPIPAPATLELLRGVPVSSAEVAWETVTPTGAAILKSIVSEYRPLPALTIEAIGHGAGDDRKGPLPNVLRAVLGREGGLGRDRVVVLEANLDDFVPEHFDYVMEQLFALGALDVSLSHLQMKKNRPGFLLRVIARPDGRLPLARALLAETTTLGVRVSECDRLLLPREQVRVTTPWGPVRVKIAHGEDGRVDVSAEYDDVKRVARKAGVPLREVVRRAEQIARGIST